MRKPPRRTLIIAAAGGIAISAALLFFPSPFGLGKPGGPAGSALRDSLHFPLFFLLTGCLYLFSSTVSGLRGRRGLRIAASACAALVVAVCSEWIQGKNGRTTSFTDLLNDLLGIASTAAFLGWIWRSPPRPARGVRLGLTIVVASVAFAAIPVLIAWKAERSQVRIFPDLGGFSSDDAFFFWKPQGKPEVGMTTSLALAPGRSTSGQVLYVKCAPAAWSGVSKSLALGTRDWSAFEALSLSIENSGEPFELGIRLDGANSKISTGISVPSGVTPILLPFDSFGWRPDAPAHSWLKDVRKLVLHTGDSPVAHPFIVNDIRLIPAVTYP